MLLAELKRRHMMALSAPRLAMLIAPLLKPPWQGAVGHSQGDSKLFTLSIIEVDSGAVLHEMHPVEMPLSLTYALSGESLAVGLFGGHLRMIDMDSFAVLWDVALSPNSYAVQCLACAPNGESLAAGGGEGHLRIVEASSGEVLHDIPYHYHGNDVMQGSWDTSHPWPIGPWRGGTSIYDVVYLPSSDCIAVGCLGGHCRIFETSSGVLLHDMVLGSHVNSVVCAPSDRKVAAGCSDGHLRIVDLDSSKICLDVSIPSPEHSHRCICGPLACSPSGESLAAGCDGGHLYIIEAKSGNAFHDITLGQSNYIDGLLVVFQFNDVAYGLSGKTLVAADHHGYFIIDAGSGVILHEVLLDFVTRLACEPIIMRTLESQGIGLETQSAGSPIQSAVRIEPLSITPCVNATATANETLLVPADAASGIDVLGQMVPVITERLGWSDTQTAEVIPPEEATRIQEEQWASATERFISCGMATHGCATPAAGMDQSSGVVVLTFGRNSKGFDEALRNSELAHELCARGVNVQPPWANGAKILAAGITVESLADFPGELGLRNVVVYEADEPAIYAALQELPYGQRPRLKPMQGQWSVPSPDNLDCFLDVSAGSASSTSGVTGLSVSSLDTTSVPVERTFVHFSEGGASSPRTVSTSQWRGLGNPRGWAPRSKR